MSEKALGMQPYLLELVPNHLKNEMPEEAMHIRPASSFMSHHIKTQKMFIKAAEVDPWQLDDVPDQYKVQEMCDDVVNGDSHSLQNDPDWIVTKEPVKI